MIDINEIKVNRLSDVDRMFYTILNSSISEFIFYLVKKDNFVFMFDHIVVMDKKFEICFSIYSTVSIIDTAYICEINNEIDVSDIFKTYQYNGLTFRISGLKNTIHESYIHSTNKITWLDSESSLSDAIHILQEKMLK